ncbi:glutamine amidotransferase, partial [Tremellales sp. Uapishka_1]
MCRWFTYLGEEPQLLEDILLRPSHSIVKQSAATPPSHSLSSPERAKSHEKMLKPTSANDTGSPNPLTNMDGFGVGWWSDSYENYQNGKTEKDGFRPVTYKNVRPPLNDLVLKSLARGVETKAAVAHIRAGTGLTPVVQTNCHPYTFGRHLFCHNGVLGSFHLFKTQLLTLLPLRYQLGVLGTTDSEHIAALYFFHLCGEDGDWEELYPVAEMGAAMTKTLKVLESLKAEAEEKHKVPAENNALNLLCSSGSSLIATRYATPAGSEPPSLYYSTVAGATLNRKFKGHPDEGKPGSKGMKCGDKDKDSHGKHVIIGSEPNTYDQKEWDLIPPASMLLVDENIELKLEHLEI